MNSDTQQTQSESSEKMASRYRGTMGEMSNAELAASGWYVRHRALLRRIGLWVLGLTGGGFLAFGLFQWGAYLLFGYSGDQAFFARQVQTFPNYAAIQPLYAARDLQVVRPDVFASAPGRYDFVANVTNHNERWVAIVTYQFAHSRGETDRMETILLPMASRPVVALGTEASGFPTNARLVIVDIDWVHINAHAIPDVAAYVEERLAFDYENVSFDAASASEGTVAHRLTFDLINNTAYSYWQPLLYVELFDGNRRVGVLPLVLDTFRSGDVRTVDLRSLAEQLRVDDIVLHPVINVFDSREFMEPGT